MVVCRGIKHSVGDYQGNPYDNMILHCDCSDDGKMVCGEPVEQIKVKTPVFNEILSRHKYQVGDLIGAALRIYYGKFSVVDDFEIIT